MDLRIPSAARLADALRPILLPCPGAVGMHLGAGAVEADSHAVHFLLPKRGEQPLENAVAGPAAEPGVDRGPIAEPPRQGPPFVAVLHDVQYRVDEDDVRKAHVPTLNRQEGVDFGAMFRRDLFHDCAPLDFYLIGDRHLSTNPSRI